MAPCLLAVLCLSFPVFSSASIFLSVPEAPVSCRQGATVTLPCWLDPPENAENLEVRWYRGDQFDSPVLLYRKGRLDKGSPQASFGLRDGRSDGLKAGDVTLVMANVTLQEEGDYTCYVSSDTGYQRASISLHVIVIGTSPRLSVVWTESGSVNVSCVSEGWYPKPRLELSDQRQHKEASASDYETNADGLMSVRSWILLSNASTVTCSVGLSEEKKDGELYLPSLDQPASDNSGAWVAFIVTLVTLIALGAVIIVGLMYLRMKGKAPPKHDVENHTEELAETQPLVTAKGLSEDLNEARQHRVKVTVDGTANRYLIVKGTLVRDRPGEFPDGEEVTSLTSILGTGGFSSGQAYWEVEMGNEKVRPKTSWWIGVANNSFKPEDWRNPLTPSSGAWFLSSDKDNGFRIHPAAISFPVQHRPLLLGVHLDYDGGKLSFYDAKNEALIVTLENRFEGEVFPLFNPGKGDVAPLSLDVNERALNSDVQQNSA